MHKNKLLPAQLLGSRKGKLQPSCLSQAQLTVAALVVHPAAGAANGVLPNPKGVVVKQGNGFNAVLLKKGVYLAYRAPPKVVIALQQNLLPRQAF